MLIQKTFHVHQPLTATKARLSNLRSFRRVLEGVREAASRSEGVLRLECKVGHGFTAIVELLEIPTDDKTQTLFRSVDGNMELVGLVEYFEVKDDLTEVQITLDYSIHSSFHSALDSISASVERFVNRQLRRVRAHLAGVETIPARDRFAAPNGFGAQLAH